MTFLLEHNVFLTCLFVVYCGCVSALCWWWTGGEEDVLAKKRLYDRSYFGGTLPVFCGFACYLWAGGSLSLTVVPAVYLTPPAATSPAPAPGLAPPMKLKGSHFVPAGL